jgi:Uma2 family endonuclease
MRGRRQSEPAGELTSAGDDMVTVRSEAGRDTNHNAVVEYARDWDRDVHYPESDGEPWAEGEIQGEEMVRITETLQDYFDGRPDVYVWMNLFVYYERGNPAAVIAPDVFVVFGVPKRPRRRSFRIWEEGAPPAVVVEVTSESTRDVDLRQKWARYALIGVREYVMYDPTADYLAPPLQCPRLAGSDYQPMPAGPDGMFLSDALGLGLKLVDGRLQLFDRRTGERLLSRPERINREVAARHAAEARAAELERQIEDLRTRLSQQGESAP